MKNNTKGVLLVGLGASSYGALATVVKLAYARGFTTAEVSTSQFAIGLTGLLFINLFFRKRSTNNIKASSGHIGSLMLGGCSLGLTSVFYYFSVKYVPVSVAIVLLMQSVWMGLLLEAVLEKKLPSKLKIISVIAVLAGTLLATNIGSDVDVLNWKGVAWGLTAALSYTISLYVSNSIATDLKPMQRSVWMLAGGLMMIILIFASNSYSTFNFAILWPWGLFLAFFGTILPPLLFTSGMPLTGIGLGTIVASVELPISVLFAYILLKEPVTLTQWLGIALIISAIMLMNGKDIKQPASVN